MNIKWDFSELTNFANHLSSRYDLETALMTATQNIARVLHQYLLTNTPIKTGNLRKMWSAGDNLMFTVVPLGNGYEVTLVNTARANDENGFMYGLAVNDGHKTPGGGGWVMGRFFVEKSIELTKPQIEQIIMNELIKWWDSV